MTDQSQSMPQSDSHPNAQSNNQNQKQNQQPSSKLPLFSLGQVVSTPGALNALHANKIHPLKLLNRHVHGDWGDLDDEDKKANDMAVRDGSRVFSAYVLDDGTKVWCITEWDRSVTTFLLPQDY